MFRMESPRMPVLFYVAFAVIFVLLFYKWLFLKLYPTILEGLPHNVASARRILGDVRDVIALTSKTREQSESMFLINQRANSPIVQLLTPSFGPSTVLIDDPREAEDILMRRGREFDRSSLTRDFYVYFIPNSSIVQYTTPALRAQKRAWADTMSTKFLRQGVGPNIYRTVHRLVQLWRWKAMTSPGGVFETKKDLYNASIDVLWAAVFGSDLGVLGNQIGATSRKEGDQKGQLESGDDLPMAAKSSLATFLNTMEFLDGTMATALKAGTAGSLGVLGKLIKLTPRYRRVKKDMDAELQRLVAASRARFEALSGLENGEKQQDDQETCAMDLVIQRILQAAAKEGRPSVFNEDALRDELLLFILAGLDSTGNTLAWCMKFLSLHQDAQSQLRAALKSSLNDSPTASDIIDAKIPYLDAFIEECLRYALTVGAIVRTATIDTQLLGCHIPAGTHIVMNTRIFKRPIPISEDLRSITSQAAQKARPRGGIEGMSGQNLDKFDPTRWLYTNEHGKEAFDADALPNLVFGGGLRGCFGKRLAMQDLRVVIVLLVLSFEFLPLPDELSDTLGEEAIFRHPRQSPVKLRAL